MSGIDGVVISSIRKSFIFLQIFPILFALLLIRASPVPQYQLKKHWFGVLIWGLTLIKCICLALYLISYFNNSLASQSEDNSLFKETFFSGKDLDNKSGFKLVLGALILVFTIISELGCIAFSFYIVLLTKKIAHTTEIVFPKVNIATDQKKHVVIFNNSDLNDEPSENKSVLDITTNDISQIPHNAT
jgi:hypothetical protein